VPGAITSYNRRMRKMNVRMPDALAAEIEAAARKRGVSKAQIVRERLLQAYAPLTTLAAIGDLIGSVDGLPADLSARKKAYLRAGYGRKRSR
jgi:hypothetical protein